MSRIPVLDTRAARWDRMRDGVSVPTNFGELVVSLSALEGFVNRRLDPEEAIEVVADERARLAAIANTLAPQDGVITITSSIMNSRSWEALPHNDGPEDSGPVYLEHGDTP